MKPVAWKPVVRFEGLYEVSSDGQIRNFKTGKTLVPHHSGGGYLFVSLFVGGRPHNTKIHHAVAEAFVGPRNGREINHKDGDKDNNYYENLEWVTRSENVLHGYYELGHLIKPVIGTHKKTGEIVAYKSLSDASNDGFNRAHIGACAAGKPKMKSHKGYVWRFA